MLKNTFIASLIFGLMATSASAVEYSIVRKGQTYEYDAIFQFTNPRARVLDKKNGRVLIEILEGDNAGEVDWVSASKLLTTSESQKQEAENIGAGIGIGLAVLCTLTNTCPKKEEEPPKQKTALISEGTDRRVSIGNKCSKPVEIWLAYYNDGKFLGQNVFWTIQPDETVTLNSKGGGKLYADNSKFFYFAQSEGKEWTWDGDEVINLEGKKKLKMREINAGLKGGKFNFNLTCDG